MENGSLGEWIREQIEAGGPVPFARFMEWALYHPQLGYYSRGPSIGVRGDFVTSPEASSAFGSVLVRHVAEIDGLLGRADPFDLVEFGPGNGTLARDLLGRLRSEHPDLYGRLVYRLVDVSPALRQVQRETLGSEHAGKVEWASEVAELPRDLAGAAIANEVVDAFPVHVLRKTDGRLLEEFVALSEGSDFKIVLREPSERALADFVSRAGIEMEEGERVEVNLAARQWIADLTKAFRRGVFTIIDYGDTRPGRYSKSRLQGTLLAYYGGAVTDNVLARPGLQDLTALVDFTDLSETAEKAGLSVIGMTRQANFLIGLGLGTGDTAIGNGPSLDEALAARKGIQALVSPEGLGRFHVLLLGKGIDPGVARTSLPGLRYAGI